LKSKTNQSVNIIALLKELQSMVDVGAIKHNVKKSKSFSINNLTTKRLRGGAGGSSNPFEGDNKGGSNRQQKLGDRDFSAGKIPRLKSGPLFPMNHKSDCNYHGPEAGHSTLNCKCIPTKWAVPSDAYPNCFVSVNTGKPTKAMKIYMEKEQQPKVEGKQSKGKGSKRLVEEIKAEPADNTNNDRKRVRFLNARIEP
jgi:hypothetical protein